MRRRTAHYRPAPGRPLDTPAAANARRSAVTPSPSSRPPAATAVRRSVAAQCADPISNLPAGCVTRPPFLFLDVTLCSLFFRAAIDSHGRRFARPSTRLLATRLLAPTNAVRVFQPRAVAIALMLVSAAPPAARSASPPPPLRLPSSRAHHPVRRRSLHAPGPPPTLSRATSPVHPRPSWA